MTPARTNSSAAKVGLSYPWSHGPKAGQLIEVAPGVWWAQLPTPTHVDHVNVYFLADGNDLVLLDTGYGHDVTRDTLRRCLSHEALRHKKLTRIIVTHFHPDHIGLAGELCRENIELWTSRTTWAYSRLLWQDQEPSPTQAEQRFLIQAGLSQLELVAQRYRQYPEYSQVVTPIPSAFFPLCAQQTLKIGDRQWQVRMGYGHAPELVMLWTDDLAIVSDQILPNIAPTLSVSFTEPQVDLVSEWLKSCSAIVDEGNDEVLCLPGHHLPFRGAALRCHQLRDNTMRLIARVLELIVKPRTARDCLEELYRRPMNVHECRTYALEVMGILNHLWHLGQVDKHTTPAGVIFWQRRG